MQITLKTGSSQAIGGDKEREKESDEEGDSNPASKKRGKGDLR